MIRVNPPRRRRNFFRRAQLKRYKARPFQNPYFRKHPKRPLLSFAIGGLVCGTILAMGSFLLTSPRFVLTSVSVEGATSTNPRIIRDAVETYLDTPRFIFFRARNRFLYQEDRLREHLATQFRFEYLDIRLAAQNLRLTVKEKISSVIWVSGDRSYLVDATGSVIRELNAEELASSLSPPPIQGPSREGEELAQDPGLIVVEDRAKSPVEVGGSVLGKEDVERMIAFADGLKKMGILTVRHELDRTVGAWLRVATDDGYDILFDPASDVDGQLNRLTAVLKDQIRDPSTLEYIDLRFGNRVYFK